MKKTILIFLSMFLLSCDLTPSNNIISNESIETNESIFNSYNSESNESTSSESNDFQYTYFDKQYKLYINPSVQYANLYSSNLGNEGVHMNSISIILVDLLKQYTNLIVYSNNLLPGKKLSDSVKESNSLNVDYHIALHSNAGGGKGSEIFYTRSSYDISKSILDSMQEILPYNTRGLKDGESSLYELKNTTGSACLIEILFHDDKNQALFIINNQKEIAKAIFHGIVSYLS